MSTQREQMINTDMFDCDYYWWKDGKSDVKYEFEGEFLQEYSWGEYILAGMMKNMDKEWQQGKCTGSVGDDVFYGGEWKRGDISQNVLVRRWFINDIVIRIYRSREIIKNRKNLQKGKTEGKDK